MVLICIQEGKIVIVLSRLKNSVDRILLKPITNTKKSKQVYPKNINKFYNNHFKKNIIKIIDEMRKRMVDFNNIKCNSCLNGKIWN